MPKLTKPTEAQIRYMRAVHRGDVTTSYGYVNSAPHGITMTTHNICLERGWVRVAAGAYNERKAVSITEAGLAAALQQKGEAR